MRTGRIDLYDWNDKLISSMAYDGLPGRKRIIEIWNSRYQHKIRNCYFQIRPDVKELRIKENGENQYVGRPKKYKQVEKIFLKTS